MAKKEIKKSKNFWAYFVLGGLLILIGILLAPFWQQIWAECPWGDWGSKIVQLFVAALIVLYLGTYLIKKVKHHRGTIQVLTIIEFILLSLVALGLVFTQFKVLNISSEPSQILGLIFYLRGTIEIFRAYYYQRDNKIKYPVWWLVISILFVTFGVYLWFNSIISTVLLVWILAILCLVLGILSIAYGVMAKPAQRKSAPKKAEPKKEEVKKEEVKPAETKKAEPKKTEPKKTETKSTK